MPEHRSAALILQFFDRITKSYETIGTSRKPSLLVELTFALSAAANFNYFSNFKDGLAPAALDGNNFPTRRLLKVPYMQEHCPVAGKLKT